jgi:hypothetical protein
MRGSVTKRGENAAADIRLNFHSVSSHAINGMLRMIPGILAPLSKFIQKTQKYGRVEALDAYALLELVSAIYMEAPDESSGKRSHRISIQYDGINFVPL